MRRIVAAACSVAALVLIAASSWFMLRHLERQREKRLQDAVRERTRAARELQDTLLQNFQGVLLKFHAATSLLLTRPDDARAKLDEALTQADLAIAEARDAMQAFPASQQDLVEDLTQLGSELGADPSDEDAPVLRVEIHGRRRHLSPLVRDQVHRIAREAMRAAFQRSGVDRVELRIDYGPRRFELCIRDNGEINAAELGCAGSHNEALGPSEEPSMLTGVVAVQRRTGGGTEVVLAIPAREAY